MRELGAGVLHWTAFRREIGTDVSSYYLEPAGTLVDPMVPDEGFAAFDGRERPRQVVLTTGLHTRHAARFAAEFGIPIRVSPEGAQRIGDRLDVELYRDGEELAPGVRALKVGVLCPDEYALHAALGDGALSLADALGHYGGRPDFFDDELLGDDPAAVKDGLRERLRALLDLDFDTLLFAHGDPIAGGGKDALRAVVAGGAR
jgi:hypothetical protein